MCAQPPTLLTRVPMRTFSKKFDKPDKSDKLRKDEKLSVTRSDHKFDYTQDGSMRTWGFNILAVIVMFVVSKAVTERLVNRYFYQGTEEKVADGPRFLDRTRKGQVYKTSAEIDNELGNAQLVCPDDLRLQTFFSPGRNYFIQITAKDDDDLHGHFFHLKRLAWKKNQPLYLLKLNPGQFASHEAELR